MTIAAGPYAIAAALLAIGGALKLARPADTANALRGLRLPGSPGMDAMCQASSFCCAVFPPLGRLHAR